MGFAVEIRIILVLARVGEHEIAFASSAIEAHPVRIASRAEYMLGLNLVRENVFGGFRQAVLLIQVDTQFRDLRWRRAEAFSAHFDLIGTVAARGIQFIAHQNIEKALIGRTPRLNAWPDIAGIVGVALEKVVVKGNLNAIGIIQFQHQVHTRRHLVDVDCIDLACACAKIEPVYIEATGFLVDRTQAVRFRHIHANQLRVFADVARIIEFLLATNTDRARGLGGAWQSCWANCSSRCRRCSGRCASGSEL